jgi:hypothetical protein
MQPSQLLAAAEPFFQVLHAATEAQPHGASECAKVQYAWHALPLTVRLCRAHERFDRRRKLMGLKTLMFAAGLVAFGSADGHAPAPGQRKVCAQVNQ